MKSLALSLLVALGISLGAVSASAETQPVYASGVMLPSQVAARLAKQHAEKAQEYRVAARLEIQKAEHCLRIARDDDAQGFTYEAGVMREKAAQHFKAAQAYTNTAERHEALALKYRKEAQSVMGRP